MSRIINYYTEFYNSIPVNNNDVVDMVSLFNQCDNWTPVQLKYNNKTESIENLSAVAIRNVCQLYKNERTLDKVCVHNLSRIVIGSANAHIIAQRMLLIHYSKRRFDLSRFSYMLMHTCNMRVKDVVDRDEAEWIKLAHKVVSHIEINAIIDEAISQFGLPVCKVAEPYVDIRIVEFSIPAIRGFVGINQIFIHTDNFGNKIKAFRGSLALLQQIARIDIIALAIHELAHMKMRRITNDLNSHTPVMADNANIPSPPNGDIEFGVFVERKVFGKQVNWFESAPMLQQKGELYVKKFIESVEKQMSLPDGQAIKEFVEREDILHAVSGMDIEVKSEIC